MINDWIKPSIRFKITGKCNLNCNFCHKEGNMEIDDMIPNDRFIEVIDKLTSGINSINVKITGGEPLLNQHVEDIVLKFHHHKKINTISLITNGTILKSKQFWLNLKNNGLHEVVMSINNVKGQDEYSNNHINQISNLELLSELGYNIKINTIAYNDFNYTRDKLSNLLKLKKKYNFDIVILNNLFDIERSQSIIYNLIEYFSMKIKRIFVREGTSNQIILYSNKDHSIEFYIKISYRYFSPEYCNNCEKKDNCYEGFYGSRIEIKNGKYYERLCLYRNDDKVNLAI